MLRALAAAVVLSLSGAASGAPLSFFDRPPSLADPTMRDAVADPKLEARRQVSLALGRLAAGDAAGAVELSARALTLDPSDESAFAVLKLAQTQLNPLRDAVSAAPAFPARAPIPPLGSEGFWRLVFSPVIVGLLFAGGAAHLAVGRIRRRALTTLRVPGSGALPVLPEEYRCVGVLGEGGMGVVYAAEDKKLGRKVAVKKMRDEIKRNLKEREHFLEEARMVAGLHHPTIVDIHTIIEHGEDLFLVFEYIEGKTVERLLAERKALNLDEIKRVMRGVCDALEYAHRQGVVHRDLKPSNIMVAQDGQIKVMDFGVARRAKDQLMRFTLTQTVAGTPLYMAPEAEDGVIRREADVYALGACLYEMATGAHPFPSPASRSAKLGMRYVPPSRQRQGLPAALDVLIDRTLQPDPDRRLATPREFIDRLEEIF